MSRPSRLALALFAALACVGGPARGDGVVADLSSHLIAITTGFTGASVVLFGATEGRGDIITVVRGPEREMTVWRKGKVAGIWVNAESVVFGNVPSFYAVAASRPVDEIIAPGPAALYRIGTGNLRLQPKSPATPDEAARFGTALVAEQNAKGCLPRIPPRSLSWVSACSGRRSAFPRTCRPAPISSKFFWCGTAMSSAGRQRRWWFPRWGSTRRFPISRRANRPPMARLRL